MVLIKIVIRLSAYERGESTKGSIDRQTSTVLCMQFVDGYPK